MRRTTGRLAQLLVLTVGALALGRGGLALGTARAAERHVFLPLAVVAGRGASAQQRGQQGLDSARVARLLQAARGEFRAGGIDRDVFAHPGFGEFHG